MSELNLFFQTMRAFLLGRINADMVETTLGTSPSGTQRLVFYRTLVRNDHHGFMEKLFGFTQDALKERFSDYVDRFLTEHPPSHWEPNQIGERFPDWLRGQSDLLGIAPWIAELAQYEWFEFVVYTDPSPDYPTARGLTLNPTMRALRFEFDVPGWVAAGRPTSDINTGPPKRDLILLIYRDPRTLQCKFLETTPWTHLIVASLENGENPFDAATMAGCDLGAANQAVGALVHAGLLFNDPI